MVYRVSKCLERKGYTEKPWVNKIIITTAAISSIVVPLITVLGKEKQADLCFQDQSGLQSKTLCQKHTHQRKIVSQSFSFSSSKELPSNKS